MVLHAREDVPAAVSERLAALRPESDPGDLVAVGTDRLRDPTRRLHRRRLLEARGRTARRAHVGRRHDARAGIARSGRSPRRCSTFRPERARPRASCWRVTSGERARLTVATAITTTATTVAVIAIVPVAPSDSPKSVTPINDPTTGSVTAIAGSDAARCPAWNALWLSTNPTNPAASSAYGCQWREDVDHATVEQVERRLREGGGEAVDAPGREREQERPPARAPRRVPRSRRSRSGPTRPTDVRIHASPEACARPPCGSPTVTNVARRDHERDRRDPLSPGRRARVARSWRAGAPRAARSRAAAGRR